MLQCSPGDAEPVRRKDMHTTATCLVQTLTSSSPGVHVDQLTTMSSMPELQ